MQLSQYISDLLYRYECVTLPNFGAFLSHPVSARINEATNDFYPPHKQLSFNVQLKSNDGLLASYISDVENISFEGATSKIENQVAQLKAQLDKGDTVEFKHIGALTSEEGKLLFVPSDSLNYRTDAFGLAPFVSPSIERQAHQAVIQKLEASGAIALSPKRSKSSVYFKYAAIAVLALGLSGSIGSNVYLSQIEKQNTIAIETANATLDSKIQEATFVIDNPLPAVMVSLKKQSGDFHIVAGAFRVEANSYRKLQQLKSLGYDARIIGANKYGLHQVVYESFETREDAQNALFKIKKTHNRAAWLLIKDLP